MDRNLRAAEQARQAAAQLARTLHEKQLAYGDSGRIAHGLWEARLAQYLTEDGAHYRIPVALMRHVPRITRVDDRINRLIANPGGDRMGESPWLDMAGDAVIGYVVTADPALHNAEDRTETDTPDTAAAHLRDQRAPWQDEAGRWRCPYLHPHTGKHCQRTDVHGREAEHRYDAGGGLVRWHYSGPVRLCPHVLQLREGERVGCDLDFGHHDDTHVGRTEQGETVTWCGRGADVYAMAINGAGEEAIVTAAAYPSNYAADKAQGLLAARDPGWQRVVEARVPADYASVAGAVASGARRVRLEADAEVFGTEAGHEEQGL